MPTDVPSVCGDDRNPRPTADVIAPARRATQADLRLTIRELRISDTRACTVFIQHLERQDLRMRFASPHFSIDHFLPGCVGALRRASFAAFQGARTILGIANLIHLNPDKGGAAVIVRSDYKRHRIGRSLLAQVMQSARDAGMSRSAVPFVLASVWAL